MTSQKFAVLGDPIEHSLSPDIHRAAYRHLGLDWTYDKIQVKSGELANFVANEGSVFDGFSVTMPLKEEAARLADQTHYLVQQLGIANTLVRSDKGFAAYNTDVFGIMKSLESCWAEEPESIALFGAGATAQSALMAIHLEAPSAKVKVFVRESTNVEPIASLAMKVGLNLSIATFEEYGQAQHLTINTIPTDSLKVSAQEQSGWLLDANYAKPDRTFAEHFDSEKVVTGQSMLLWQAIAQIRLFTTADMDKELPDESDVLRTMKAAL